MTEESILIREILENQIQIELLGNKIAMNEAKFRDEDSQMATYGLKFSKCDKCDQQQFFLLVPGPINYCQFCTRLHNCCFTCIDHFESIKGCHKEKCCPMKCEKDCLARPLYPY